MEKSSRTIEINVISGEGLRVNRTQPVKKNTFVTLQAEARDSHATTINTEGGSYPAWNEKFVIEMPMHARFVTVEVHYKTYSGNKVIGTAKIPVTDFLGGYLPENYLHFLSYRLRDEKGERNGIINLSVRVKVPENAGCAASYSRPWTGGSVGEKVSSGTNYLRPWPGAPVGGNVSSEIVTGVPVWHKFQV